MEMTEQTSGNTEVKASAHDVVNHPSWYCDGGIETLDFILAKKLDFLTGQVIKYITRSGKKDPGKALEDLKKAQFYLNRKIAEMEKSGTVESRIRDGKSRDGRQRGGRT